MIEKGAPIPDMWQVGSCDNPKCQGVHISIYRRQVALCELIISPKECLSLIEDLRSVMYQRVVLVETTDYHRRDGKDEQT